MLSIIITLIGFYFVFKYNTWIYDTISQELFLKKELNISILNNVTLFGRLYKIVIISIGLLGFYLGLIPFLKKHKIGLIGIILAIILIVLAFIPFWQYAIEGGTLDINF